MNASSKHITPDTLLKYVLTGLSFLIITIVGSLLFASTPKAQAQSCTTTSLGSVSASAYAEQSQQGGTASDSDSDSVTVDVSDYVGSEETADSISFEGETSADVSSGCNQNRCEAEGSISVDFNDKLRAFTDESPGDDSDNGTVSVSVSDSDTVEIEAEASATVDQYIGPSAGADAGTTNDIEITVCDDGGGGGGGGDPDDPVAVDDGTIEQKVCTGLNTITIDVMDNDYDPNDYPFALRSVMNPTDAGGTAVINSAQGGTIDYTPSSTGADRFTYTIENQAGGRDTATVNLDVNAEGCGSVTINAEDVDGGSANLDSLGFSVDGTPYSGSGSSFSLQNIDLSDTPISVETGRGYISDPVYEVGDFNKSTNGPDGHPQSNTQSALGI